MTVDRSSRSDGAPDAQRHGLLRESRYDEASQNLSKDEASQFVRLKAGLESTGGLTLTEKSGVSFTVVTARHPTLGKLVIVIGKDGSGMVVETDE
ncbi:MAG: hypothetical protein JZU52_00860 [Lamprocystis purpurea]|nr:hypothetical protein [Lamprocystis purpurea]